MNIEYRFDIFAMNANAMDRILEAMERPNSIIGVDPRDYDNCKRCGFERPLVAGICFECEDTKIENAPAVAEAS